MSVSEDNKHASRDLHFALILLTAFKLNALASGGIGNMQHRSKLCHIRQLSFQLGMNFLYAFLPANAAYVFIPQGLTIGRTTRGDMENAPDGGYGLESMVL